jgi:hypothetical protein
MKEIIIVSGLPRSGTSMMMKMLEAGGMTLLTDNFRKADEDNPKGYFEFERVKKLKDGDTAWLADAHGKAVKVISALLPHLPPTYNYRIIFMERSLSEVLASQRKMLLRRGEDPDKVGDEEMSRLFEKHLKQVMTWMESQLNIQHIIVNYNQMLEDPGPHITRINHFLGEILDTKKMAEVIDPVLYRQRQQAGQAPP